jgi:hypothetical protein
MHTERENPSVLAKVTQVSNVAHGLLVKVMVPEQLRPQQRKVILHVFLREILAKRTQVSDVAHGPLVIRIAVYLGKRGHH